MAISNKNSQTTKRSGFVPHLGKLALGGALVAVLAAVTILFGARLGLWEPRTGFVLYRTWFDLIAIITAGLSFAVLIFHLIRRERSGQVFAGLALVIGLGLSAPLISALLDPPVRAPAIHDITTDTQNPPVFIVLDETRAGAINSLVYDGAETATLQQQAYPDIAPILTNLPEPDAYQRALKVAQDMGWTIVVADDDTLRFEATARTPVFYFADDIVVVVSATADGSRIDLRSVSRVGRSDQGVNAARIRAFSEAFTG